jgi:uncharacterized protein (DUF885 family)
MKINYTLAFAFLAMISCNPQAKKTTENMDAQFDQYKNNFIEELWKIYPGWASSQGYHKYDSQLVIPDDAAREKEKIFINSNLDSLNSYSLNTLSDHNKTDHYMIENQLKFVLYNLNEEKAFQWDPSTYNLSEGFAIMLQNNYDSIDTRLHNFFLKMKNIPAFYEAAKKNISNPTLEHTKIAEEQITGGLSVFEKDLPEALKQSHLTDQEKKNMMLRADESVKSIKDFTTWLGQLKNETPRSFRLGKDLYDKKFQFEIQSRYTTDEIYGKALEHKKELHQKMAELSSQLWDKYFHGEKQPDDTLKLIRKMIDRLSLIHVKPDSFQTAIEQQIPVLVNFIKEKNIVYLDPSKPLVVRREPDYMAGVAGASITAPGPYDKNGNTYYNVGSLSGWDKDRAESYLREYNHYVLQILNIHEAIPGHYVQLIYSNQSPSLIKSLFGSNSMIEGWAVYTERMMIEEGYGHEETSPPGQSSPEMWLMYYKWNLRSTCNTILDYSVHTKNMSKEDAMNLLVNEAFQQQAEAEGKWRRVSLTQVQLCCYFTGYTEIYDFREEMKKQMGDKFNLKNFHEKFLSYGSAPVKYIRELMMGEEK